MELEKLIQKFRDQESENVTSYEEPNVNRLDAPIPGQSLTDEPGNYPWEHPPKTTDPEDALNKFWDTKYDLILFDNHPVKENTEEWKSLLRIFAKKLLSQKASFAIFLGNDIDENSLKPFLNLNIDTIFSKICLFTPVNNLTFSTIPIFSWINLKLFINK